MPNTASQERRDDENVILEIIGYTTKPKPQAGAIHSAGADVRPDVHAIGLFWMVVGRRNTECATGRVDTIHMASLR